MLDRQRLIGAMIAAVVATWISGCGGGKAGADVPVADSGNGVPTSDSGASQASIGHLSATDLDRALKNGLVVWRTQRLDINGIDKGACANCHSADGIELGMYGFVDADILRRAHNDGVSTADQQTLVQYFAALRQKYGVTASTLRNTDTDRPFQPGGSPYEGSTIAERDSRFAYGSLASELPTLMAGTVDSLDKAHQAKLELQRTNPLKTRIGIPLPRIAEDCSFGAEHCSLNDWIADLPRLPKADMSDRWFALNDAYIADPSDANFRTMLMAIDTMTTPWKNPDEASAGAAGELGTQKFKAIQILQHFIRRQQLGLFNPATDLNPLRPLIGLQLERPDFPFIVGDYANNKDGTVLERPAQLPIFVAQSLGQTASASLTNDDIATQKGRMRTPWWYVGFMLDDQLQSGTGSEYFIPTVAYGAFEGYIFHSLYASVVNAAAVPWRNAKTHVDDPALPALSGMVATTDADLDYLFDTPQARDYFRKATANFVRAYLFLMREQMATIGVDTVPADVLANSICGSKLRDSTVAALTFDPKNASITLGVYNDILTLAGCQAAAIPVTYKAGTGTGLQVEWFREADQTRGTLASSAGSHVEPIIDMFGERTPTGYFYRYTASLGVPVVADGSVPASGSTRATGSVMAPITGDFVIAEGSGAFGRIWVNGQLVFDDVYANDELPKITWGRTQGGALPFRAMQGVSIHLEAGKRYSLVYERYGNPSAGMSLGWTTVDGRLPFHVVPAEQLYPTPP